MTASSRSSTRASVGWERAFTIMSGRLPGTKRRVRSSSIVAQTWLRMKAVCDFPPSLSRCGKGAYAIIVLTKGKQEERHMAQAPRARGVTRCGQAEFAWGQRTFVMGVINVTPDSFSGDGLGRDVAAAVAQALRFVEEGADILDVGGESTRPGHKPITVEEELGRVMPVLEALAGRVSVPLSIDTYKSAVARRALEAGACLINDIWGLKRDPELAALAAQRHIPIVLMHNQEGTRYHDLLPDIIASLQRSLSQALAAGVSPENIILDPGIGFGKDLAQNLEVMRHLGELRALGQPVLLGTSRKSLIGRTLKLPEDQRVEGTAATVALGVAQEVDMVRVHDVGAMVRVCRMADAIVRGKYP
ncbi:MAG: dihydropteroate synthase [Chloroflexi bacterium]|nr:dihydropteroate synthase [Chloroflexota bacterium]